jgi:hypothetical protein
MKARTIMRVHCTALGIAALAVVAAGPAGAVTIADVVANPDAYEGTSVTVIGDVDRAVAVGSESGFDLRDGSARITVISRSGAPTVGAHLAITATVRTVSEGDDAESNDFPPLLVESSRAPAP